MGVLPRALRLQADPFLRHRRQHHRPDQPRDHLALRQDPHSAERSPRTTSSQIEEYLRKYKGEGIQHIAVGTDDIYDATDKLAANGLKFMPGPPDTYYDKSHDARERP